jgi:alginate O-acetyltransferase complex protein AlgI
MVFSSPVFLWYFLPLVVACYLVLPPSFRNGLLAITSLLFYAWGAGSFLFVFLLSIGFNYVAGRLIGRNMERGDERTADRAMWLAIAGNLSLLFWWKYAEFAAHQLDSVLNILHVGSLEVPSIVLPIGISFFTFHGVSYIVDIRRGSATPMRHIWDYVQYMAFFPQLIAGPIVRYHQIDDQIRQPPSRGERLTNIVDGFPRFALGLTKKVLVADNVAPVADSVFALSSHDLSSGAAWVGALAYTVQIYFDFSGYSDMAIGMARMFGFRFPENFNHPYTAVSMTDFWRRWHMTLSRWFRDYVYIPLGGSRGGLRINVRNLAFVFLLTGIWHGAAWTFILWGVYHGTLLIAERVSGISKSDTTQFAIARRLVTFLFVVFGWVLFRAPSLDSAATLMHRMLVPQSLDLPLVVHNALTPVALTALTIGLLSTMMPSTTTLGRIIDSHPGRKATVVRIGVIAMLPYAAVVILSGTFSPFLYFKF